jgi:ribosomal protein S18 acetylase RimI-like enzyme
MNMNIRPIQPQDIAALQHVLDDTGLFPSEMLPEMINGYFTGGAPDEIWLTSYYDDDDDDEQDGGTPVGFCYAAPEKLTEGTYNMLAIAVMSSHQNKGLGGAMVRALEETLRKQGHRILIVDTSGADEFATTRAFYQKKGYTQEARIRDFWSAGNDKIVYWKAL